MSAYRHILSVGIKHGAVRTLNCKVVKNPQRLCRAFANTAYARQSQGRPRRAGTGNGKVPEWRGGRDVKGSRAPGNDSVDRATRYIIVCFLASDVKTSIGCTTSGLRVVDVDRPP